MKFRGDEKYIIHISLIAFKSNKDIHYSSLLFQGETEVRRFPQCNIIIVQGINTRFVILYLYSLWNQGRNVVSSSMILFLTYCLFDLFNKHINFRNGPHILLSPNFANNIVKNWIYLWRGFLLFLKKKC